MKCTVCIGLAVSKNSLLRFVICITVIPLFTPCLVRLRCIYWLPSRYLLCSLTHGVNTVFPSVEPPSRYLDGWLSATTVVSALVHISFKYCLTLEKPHLLCVFTVGVWLMTIPLFIWVIEGRISFLTMVDEPHARCPLQAYERTCTPLYNPHYPCRHTHLPPRLLSVKMLNLLPGDCCCQPLHFVKYRAYRNAHGCSHLYL